MTKKQDQTASFMVRFNQKIFEENGETEIQWRGKISHIQGGDYQSFTDFNEALTFMQEKLASLTKEATKHQPEEEQDGILKKSFSMWKTIRDVGPQFIKETIKETIKDPKKQISNIQHQIQDQISNIGEEIGEKVQIDQWRNASRSDYQKIMNSIEALSKDLKKLSVKVDKIKKK